VVNKTAVPAMVIEFLMCDSWLGVINKQVHRGP
jgi:hypothetical protein